MKPVRWLPHALQSLTDREIDRKEADKTLTASDYVATGRPPRKIFMRRYFDSTLQQEMLLRIVVEETIEELVVVTAHKTSKFSKYEKGTRR